MKKIRKILALALAIFMLAGLMPTNVFADDTREKIYKIVATSDTNSIPKYGERVKPPKFTVTEGSPAYFNVAGTGWWNKKEADGWKGYGGETFTEGTYKYVVRIQIDGEAGKAYVLDSNGVTATVDGNNWAVSPNPYVYETHSFVWTESKEYVITKTSTETAIEIPKANTNLTYTGNPQTGVNEGTGYTLTGNTATNAGTYTAKATLKAGYKWSDGSTDVKNISFEIKKARPTFTEPTGLKGKKDKKLSTVTLPSGFTWVDGEIVLNTVGENTFKATFTPADTTNYEVIDVDLTVKVEDVVTPPEKVTLTTNIINGGGTVTVTPASATVDKGKTIVVTFNPETNYEIDTVTLDGTDVKSQVVSNKLTVTMDKSKTLTVKFRLKTSTPPTPDPDPYIPPYTPDYYDYYDYYDYHRPHRHTEDKKEDKKTEEKPEEKPIDKTEEKVERKVILVIGSNNLDTRINGNDSFKGMDVAPYIKDGRTMLPLRYIAEALGMSVDWDAKTRTVIIQDVFYRVEIPLDTMNIIVNGITYTSDVKPEIKNGRTMMPIANIARALGLVDGKDILWDNVKKQVVIRRIYSR